MAVTLCALLLAQRPNLPKRQVRGWMWLCWASMAFALLSKGLIGLILPGAGELRACQSLDVEKSFCIGIAAEIRLGVCTDRAAGHYRGTRRHGNQDLPHRVLLSCE